MNTVHSSTVHAHWSGEQPAHQPPVLIDSQAGIQIDPRVRISGCWFQLELSPLEESQDNSACIVQLCAMVIGYEATRRVLCYVMIAKIGQSKQTEWWFMQLELDRAAAAAAAESAVVYLCWGDHCTGVASGRLARSVTASNYGATTTTPTASTSVWLVGIAATIHIVYTSNCLPSSWVPRPLNITSHMCCNVVSIYVYV